MAEGNWNGDNRRQVVDINLVCYKIDVITEKIETMDVKVEKINGIKTDLNWLKKIMFIIIPSLLGAIVSLIYLFVRGA